MYEVKLMLNAHTERWEALIFEELDGDKTYRTVEFGDTRDEALELAQRWVAVEFASANGAAETVQLDAAGAVIPS